ncbi:MAG TPA: YceI family protein [Steroidobacteraceae bacterium]|nr:YceI family protein [Steroidobacteraceae bacterium]
MRLLAATIVCLAPVSVALAATPYAVDAGRSQLGFVAIQSGGDFEGRFSKFTAKIAFADADLPGSCFDVDVDMGSVDTGDDDRDEALRGPDLFDVAKFPKGHFITTGVTRKAAGQYEAKGKLTIRDVTRDIVVPFTFATSSEGGKSVAALKGGVTLDRLDYGVGQGDWKDTTWVAKEVRVKFDLRLTPRPTPPADKPVKSKATSG